MSSEQGQPEGFRGQDDGENAKWLKLQILLDLFSLLILIYWEGIVAYLAAMGGGVPPAFYNTLLCPSDEILS